MLEAVIEGTTDDIFVKGVEGRFIAVNASAAQTIGRTREELIGRTLHEVLPGRMADAMAETDRLILARGTVETFEETVSIGDETRVVLTTKGPYCARDGTRLGTFGIARDITARKAREEELTRRSGSGSPTRVREWARGMSTSSPASPRGRPASECCTASTCAQTPSPAVRARRWRR